MAKPDIQEMLTLHVRAILRRNERLEECRRPRDAAHSAAAMRALAAAGELQELLTETRNLRGAGRSLPRTRREPLRVSVGHDRR
jgi:hypothetical protein